VVGLGQVGVGAEVPGGPRDNAEFEALVQHGHVETLDDRDALDVVLDEIS